MNQNNKIKIRRIFRHRPLHHLCSSNNCTASSNFLVRSSSGTTLGLTPRGKRTCRHRSSSRTRTTRSLCGGLHNNYILRIRLGQISMVEANKFRFLNTEEQRQQRTIFSKERLKVFGRSYKVKQYCQI
ncbi:Hypothetical_protein [Hexamita inflata]|uniref:Hypothetical_protein n=1 Tax=Hexamita inflata TaxID=28002 RepID=A0AA86PAN6_9EUKA|nr:Hypothetical protein HINF_LOCUS22745 [Hexamita inflata]